MIDIKELRRDPEALQKALGKRGAKVIDEQSAWHEAYELDKTQREKRTELEELQAKRNKYSKEIGLLRKNKEDTTEAMQAVAQVSSRVKELDIAVREAEELSKNVLLHIPNTPHASVPEGLSEDDNVFLRQWGEARQDDVPAHWDIGTDMKFLDFEAGVRIAGSRFTVLRGQAARLERALMQFMLDMHVDQHGYEEVWTPAIANQDSLQATGQLPKFADDLYKLEGEDAYLIPTAEVSVTNLYRDQIIDEATLPIQHCAYTPCFRREAGSAGRDVRGMIRQHQFDKVELVHVVAADQALAALEKLTSHAEAVLQALELPYRVVELCTSDLGFSAEKTYDLEVWLPSQKLYREISSCSSMGQFQSRRAAIRMRKGKSKPESVATLNGSGVAIGRCLIAILENGWQEDGRIKLPKVLQPYFNGLQHLG
ncbi:MAG: serine--tRNA ligase [Mariprofundaceae bacterium]|nr:serine--tRNA ligase [Mariprofundaceae bacterium]